MPSPNFGPRRNGLRPSLIVLHYTAMASFEAASERLCDTAAEVSAHYLIGRDGTLAQLVDEEMRAWHAGAGAWGGQDDVNSRSIGIELDNDGSCPFSAPLMSALEALLPGIMARWDITPQGVIAHSDLAPTRKFDPGRRFDWRRLARQGLAVWPEEGAVVAPDADAFSSYAIRFGYPDTETAAALLDAFRQRFRPWAQGPLDGQDMACIENLADRFVVDRNVPSD